MTTDDKIIELQGKIEQKRAKIKRAETPRYKTNLNFVFQGNAINLNAVTDQDKLVRYFAFLLSEAEYWGKAASLLELPGNFVYGGFSLSDWTEDFKTRASIISISAEKQKLAKFEETLKSLESSELKTARILAEMEKDL